MADRIQGSNDGRRDEVPVTDAKPTPTGSTSVGGSGSNHNAGTTGAGAAGAAGAGAAAGGADRATTSTSGRSAKDRAVEDAREDARYDHRQTARDLEISRRRNTKMTDIGLLLLRVLPLIMVMHGISKVTHFAGFQQAVASNPIGGMAPQLFSFMVAAGQLVLPILVAIGLFTRIAALLEAIMMGCIWWMMFAMNGLIDPKTGGPAGESALLYVMLMLPLFFTGAGRFSIDHLIGRGRTERSAERRVAKKFD